MSRTTVSIAGSTGSIGTQTLEVVAAEPDRFEVVAQGTKVRDGDGNPLSGITLDFDVDFPSTEEGAAAEAVLRRAIELSHDRLCTVTRTVELGTAVQPRLRGIGITGTAGDGAS